MAASADALLLSVPVAGDAAAAAVAKGRPMKAAMSAVQTMERNMRILTIILELHWLLHIIPSFTLRVCYRAAPRRQRR